MILHDTATDMLLYADIRIAPAKKFTQFKIISEDTCSSLLFPQNNYKTQILLLSPDVKQDYKNAWSVTKKKSSGWLELTF